MNHWGSVVRRLRNLLKDQRGNTAIIFGLAVVPLLALGGGVIDFAHRARIHTALQSASDTAALAAARSIQNGLLRREEWEPLRDAAVAQARNFVLETVLSLTNEPPEIDIDITQASVKIDAHYDMKTAFLPVIGISQLPAETFSEVAVPDPILVEISLVLDYSLSMRQNSKYERMTAAAQDFISTVAEKRGDRSKIGIVPFSEFVYADVMNSDVRTPETGGGHPWDSGSTNDGGVDWNGGQDGNVPDDAGLSAKCLLNRDHPYSITNETPSGLEASKWRQADPDGSRCQSYRTGGLQARDLTDDFDGLENALGAMEPVGWTNIALAAEMGWHMLSPDEPFTTARDFSDPYVRKILILLTDGMQTVDAMGPDGSISVDAANQTTAELCENIKASNISLYTIAYDVDDTSVYSLMSGCASGPSSYFEVHDSSGIAAVFEEIYARIAETAYISR